MMQIAQPVAEIDKNILKFPSVFGHDMAGAIHHVVKNAIQIAV
jgi:hypothetical protein